ncbi:oxidoreductase [Mycobacterium sp. 236(2023)]|uniref:oxidoreductase n=1 Tax=Mycobacterium sp. 236(2023) TaxID=3038163 RepID=UPI0024150755|nr:oxidoreductase [Mycobacterium sp. 236(2023)]MDG4668127.1 oxidoreductase [Mycobacterium sp. 236(2023)]
MSNVAANTLSGEQILHNISNLAIAIASRAAESESNRRVGEDTIEDLKSAGAFRVASPRRHGGLESSLRSMLDTSAAIAEADGGASWVVTLSNVTCWAACSMYNQEAIDEVFANGPDVILCGVVVPTGQARRVPGGYRVSGSWAYASASLHAQWASCGAVVVDEDGQPVDQLMMLIPRADFRVEDTWYVAGMRSSGSNTIVVDDVFVPAHRATPLEPTLAGANVAAHPESALYRSAVGPMLVLVVMGPQLGLGRAALRIATTKAASKPLAYTTIGRQADSVSFQLLIAEAAARIDTAHLHAYRAADDVDRHARDATMPDLLTRARIRADSAVALQSINGALNTLLNAAGASSFAEVNPMQRIWRDSNVAARHAVTLPQVSMETYGKALLGATDNITDII